MKVQVNWNTKNLRVFPGHQTYNFIKINNRVKETVAICKKILH